ncbi:MAG: hypothetical protein KME12_00880 [Trichocoleus desertorum ATA4-8-CV12]|jgi:hypothetical protein|nr:hypothetical protein [Trichocoleus desertorum ATA4-8-CV12]
MTKAEIEAVLQAAFRRCDAVNYPLNAQQKQILLSMVVELERLQRPSNDADGNNETENPLDELTAEQRRTLLEFVKQQEQQNHPWKIKLLNDWLHNRDSASMQFIRELYGPQWLNRVQPKHVTAYAELDNRETLKVKVGDRIEVCNSLWEWVQAEGPCAPEWFSCTVIGVAEKADNGQAYTSCLIRFDSGMEYEIQGIYRWNRYNWRWPSP